MIKERYHLLDALRGLTLISMIVYHGTYDLVEIYGVDIPWFWDLPGRVWQQSVCWTFILLSGFCWSLGRYPLKRGLTVFGGGALVTAVTWIFMPSQRILFGILTFLGTAMLVMIPVSRAAGKLPAWMGLLGSGSLFFLTRNVNLGYWGFGAVRLGVVPEGLYRNPATTFLGFPEAGFWSGDYFSFFPWFFLFLCGYFLYRLLMEKETVRRVLTFHVPGLEWMGRHSLLIYLLHQPAVMAALEATALAGLL